MTEEKTKIISAEQLLPKVILTREMGVLDLKCLSLKTLSKNFKCVKKILGVQSHNEWLWG